MKKYFYLLLGVLSILLLEFAYADFTMGNPASSIEKNYGQGEIVRGWINISLEDEPVDSEFSCFDNSIDIIDFLDNAEAGYECDDDCEEDTLSSDFQVIDLSSADFEVPSSIGSHQMIISLGDMVVASKSINVQKGMEIFGINTDNTIAASPTKFVIYVFGRNISSYFWDFGDETDEETEANYVFHTYEDTGEYEMRVEIENDFGGIIGRNFNINVLSPKNAINESLAGKKTALNKVKKQIDSAGWFKEVIESQINLEEPEKEIKKLEAEYKTASADEDYIEIMSALTDLEIPVSVGIALPSRGDYFPDIDYIDPSHLSDIGGGDVDNPEDYAGEILSWFNENIDMKIESDIYSVTYSDYFTESILTSFKLIIRPKKDFNKKVYLVIEGQDIIFRQDYEQEETDLATGVAFPELLGGQEKIIEFVLEEEIEVLELPIYLSPAFSQLNVVEVSPCNFNERCEPELDEDWENCRNDCKPWKRTIIYFFIVVFIAFIVYILLQEWYRRSYERHLFRDRRNLFNLVSFINNALNQGCEKKEIIRKLKKNKWKSEQIIYAFKKVKGRRTGMWEIPILRIFRRKKKIKSP